MSKIRNFNSLKSIDFLRTTPGGEKIYNQKSIGDLLFSLLLSVKPKTVVEIATKSGYLTAVTAIASLHSKTDTKIYSAYDTFLNSSLLQHRVAIEESNLALKVSFHKNSEDLSTVFLKTRLPIDLLILGGHSSYMSVRHNFLQFSPYIREGGFILIPHSDTVGVCRYVKILADHPEYSVILVGSPSKLALVQKRISLDEYEQYLKSL